MLESRVSVGAAPAKRLDERRARTTETTCEGMSGERRAMILVIQASIGVNEVCERRILRKVWMCVKEDAYAINDEQEVRKRFCGERDPASHGVLGARALVKEEGTTQ